MTGPRTVAGGAPLDQPAPPARRRKGFDDEVGKVLSTALARPDLRRRVDPTERQFQEQIVELARHFDWLVVHHGGNQHRRAYYDTTGFPDLLMISPRGAVLFREIKTQTGKLTVLQIRWGERLQDLRADYDVWRPSDWPQIVTLLSSGKARAS